MKGQKSEFLTLNDNVIVLTHMINFFFYNLPLLFLILCMQSLNLGQVQNTGNKAQVIVLAIQKQP